MTRRLPIIAALALVAALFSGCIGIRSDEAEQVDLIGDDVRITTFVCPDDNGGDRVRGDDEDDEEDGCTTDDRDPFDVDQVLIAYRVPEDTSGPDKIEGTVRTGDDEGTELRRATVEFNRSGSYEAQLEEQDDDDGDQFAEYGKRNTKWIGYVSQELPSDAVGELKVTAPLEAARRGAFEHLTVVGYRTVFSFGGGDRLSDARHERLMRENDVSRSEVETAVRSARGGSFPDGDADRPVDCDEEGIPFRGIFGGDFTETECISDPDVPETTTTHLRELTITGGEGFATAGSTATVPFVLSTTDSPVDTHAIKLTADGGLPGATVTPQWPTTDLPLGDAPRPVDVQVPADAAPGTYPVTLTAKTGDQTRQAIGNVVVVPQPVETAEASTQRQQLFMNADGTVSFQWSCPPLCGNLRAALLSSKQGIAPTANTAQVSKPRLLRIAAARFRGQAGRSGTVRMKLFPKARRAVRRGRTVKAMVVVRNASGTPVVRRVTISRRR